MNEKDDDDDDDDHFMDDGDRITRRMNLHATAMNEDEMEINPRQQRGGIDASTKGRIKQEEGYSWTQTEEDVEVTIMLPTPGVSTKDLKVVFQSRHVLVIYQGQTTLDLFLFEAIDLDGSTWIVESTGQQSSKVVLVMEKVEQALWSRINN
jgi:CS domain